ncbi:riboflavin synthase [Legionella fallonii]|uniref:riboflavin synthase n=1 Tax=Legionella fallonii TaxID=96230 RepID=UPI0005D2FFE3|nr:riboflavin synthase [Legionella fallonii]
MFTGLIEKKSKVISNVAQSCSHRLIIESPFAEVQIGESIAVNGVCLTLLPSEEGKLNFDVSPETLNLTTLAQLRPDSFVNLERAMQAATRFGGHYVSGHVDTTALVHSIHSIDEFIAMELTGFNPDAMLYLIPKGSITVEGVSLTINAVVDQKIQFMLVPHTLLHTNLGGLAVGQRVNIEFDYLTRIVAHQLQIFGKLNCEVEL